VSAGKKDVVQVLVEKGADMEIADKGGVTPLHLAAFWGRLHIVSFLIEKGARVNSDKEYAFTPLHRWALPQMMKDSLPARSSAEKGLFEVTELLLSKGADVNKQDETGFTPLHLASKHGHRDVVSLLLYKGGSVNIK
jgi:ankyrin repeat protein